MLVLSSSSRLSARPSRLTAVVTGVALVAAAVAFAAPSPAHADDKKVALDLLGAAKYYYKKGDFKAAAARFLDAYKIDPRSEFLFNAARAEQRAMDLAAARRHYEQVLDHKPAATAVVCQRARLHLAEVKAVQSAIETARAQGKSQAQARVAQQRAAGKIRRGDDSAADRGRELQGVGGVRDQQPGGKAVVGGSVTAAPTASASPWAAYGLVGAGVAGLAVAGWAIASAASEQDALNSLTADRDPRGIVGIDYAGYATRQESVNARRRIGVIAAGLGAVAAGAGAYLWMRSRTPPVASLGPAAGFRGFVVAVQF